ncbi:transporter, major facilitator family protein [Necator americanus]|uniref:Transporter, major facilitator family protein n=1 Tax=Necator americanus TaxID=51031 RepID=W2TB28_NECAM|nr:transporter, major facilitator family protein [Necator americanus]ETN78391.1 transporter, major facilitator family protein [Necator americanus]
MVTTRSVRKAGELLSNSIRRTFSTKKWEHREQLHTLTETVGIEASVTVIVALDRFFLKKVRWQISILAHIGFAISFGIRSNFGVAKNRMVSNFTDAWGDFHEPEFYWSPTELGMMESSFFYGYAASQIPAGVLAAKFAPNKLFCLGVMIASVLNVGVAFALQYHPFTDVLVMIMQGIQGLALGVTYPAMHGVWRHWAPPLERSKLATTTFTGSYVGVMLGLPLSAALVSYLSWSAPFYVFGCVGVLWSLTWWTVSAKSPNDHSYITDEERTYITEKVGKVATGNMTLTTLPWRTILMSPPVWAIVICNFCRSWTFFLLLGNQLTYMKDVLHLDIRHSGLISALPQFMMTIVVLISGQMADWLRSTGKMNTGPVRKMFNTLGFGGEAIFLALLAFIHDPTLAVTCLVIAASLSGMSIAGFNVNHFDIAPRYASILMGFSNGFGALAGMGGFITQHLTANVSFGIESLYKRNFPAKIRGNPSGWKYCFLLAMCVDLFGIIFFLLFAQGEVQEWAREPEPEETLGEFVRRISTMVRNMSSRRRPSKGNENGSHVDYARMEEERNNSSEMKPRNLPVTTEGNSETPPMQAQSGDINRTTDRPDVA